MKRKINIALKFLALIYIFYSCSNSSKENYYANGLPDSDYFEKILFFENDSIGYVFGTYNLSNIIFDEKDRVKPNYELGGEIQIYKTVDRGHNWKFLNTINNCHISDEFLKLNGKLFFIANFSYSKNVYKLMQYDFQSNTIKELNYVIEYPSVIWEDSGFIKIKFNSFNKDKILIMDTNLIVIDSVIKKLDVKDNIVNIDGIDFSINFNNMLYNITNNNEIQIPMKVDVINKLNDKLIMGGRKKSDNTSIIVSYDYKSTSMKILKEIPNYTIIYQLIIKDNIMVSFLGNKQGYSTMYDFIYSLDYGKTWQFKDLNSQFDPSCCDLIGNILYIHSLSSMERIVLD